MVLISALLTLLDEYLSKSGGFRQWNTDPGTRISGEMIITFIISQQKTIPGDPSASGGAGGEIMERGMSCLPDIIMRFQLLKS